MLVKVLMQAKILGAANMLLAQAGSTTNAFLFTKSDPMKFYSPTLLVCVTLPFMVSPASWAQPQTIGIENIQSLSFGSFVAGNGGSVTVSADGNRKAGGSVVLISSSQGTTAQFTVSGKANRTYTVQLPDNDFVTLSGPGADMFINNFTSDPSGVNGEIKNNNSQTLSVGGTLDVGSSQAIGDYAGSFSVTVDYN